MNIFSGCLQWLIQHSLFCQIYNISIFRPSCVCILLLLLVIALTIYSLISARGFGHYDDDIINLSKKTCKQYQEHRENVCKLTVIVHDILNDMGLDHFLCYGSMWSHVRGFDGPVPWDYDSDLCALRDPFNSTEVSDIRRRLGEHNISFTEELDWGGTLKFWYIGDRSLEIDLFFYKTTFFGRVWRHGTVPYILPVHYYRHESFPVKFLNRPLPNVTFCRRHIQVPHGGIEVLKYLYPDNWDKEAKPKYFDCDVKQFYNKFSVQNIPPMASSPSKQRPTTLSS